MTMKHREKHPSLKEGPKVIALAALREPDQSLTLPLLISAGLFSLMAFFLIMAQAL